MPIARRRGTSTAHAATLSICSLATGAGMLSGALAMLILRDLHFGLARPTPHRLMPTSS